MVPLREQQTTAANPGKVGNVIEVEYASDESVDDESVQSYLAMRKVNRRIKGQTHFTRIQQFHDNV